MNKKRKAPSSGNSNGAKHYKQIYFIKKLSKNQAEIIKDFCGGLMLIIGMIGITFLLLLVGEI